ncbi:MAG TPA: GNAT family N-acetyltransferase [Verrucomicrobiae bacterium]
MTILQTNRLLFRNHIPADLEPYCEIESDPVYRSPQKVHPRTELERSFRESVSPPKPMGLLATVFKPDDKYIGRCGLYPRRGDDGNVIPGEAVLAFYFARPYWGRGLATEAGRAFIHTASEPCASRASSPAQTPKTTPPSASCKSSASSTPKAAKAAATAGITTNCESSRGSPMTKQECNVSGSGSDIVSG